MSAYLAFENISMEFPGVKALDHMSFSADKGEVVAFLGENGAGKSTMMNAIAGVWPVDEGQILIDQVDVTRLGSTGGPDSWEEFSRIP